MIPVVPATWPLLRIRAFTTLREGGVSTGEWASLNLATHVGDDLAAVAANRERLRAQWSLPSEPRWLTQVHGTRVIAAEGIGHEPPKADGSFARADGIVCAVLTADCLPIVLADRRARGVMVLHGGWRGLARGIISTGIEALALPATDLSAWLGPAIGASDYEVGEEVRAAFPGVGAGVFRKTGRDRYHADLYALARVLLQVAGVADIYGGGWSTRREARWFSYRRTRTCGRMATLAWIAR